ncbi:MULTISPECIES: DNA gyrase subunit A [Cetobacterium]|jgi:DNA gyrase subunit A|uniref:DNA gyrase subunit A n=1 Tax=Candidatus Cetobacterium colombiensis TaxID=3073100 RepID=A0ABU4WC11_9FUSO|nr:DNA gyrase subunit A [Candidatus Cetobacterium colombiensis]MDX8337064.1 DNA gyrase subunit A [Candidatus Cetobacterium colombiensis]
MSNVNNRYIEEELKQSYLDYSMSVIVSRALPDVRDGLKPVHRRILFAMNEMGMTSDKPYKKSARIVGEVLGKYHPHGDSAVYNTMVRMAQNFAYRYELVDGHGNFGSIDGDSAAAMRYTEARMSKISNELLEDIDKDTIDFRKNFDDSLDEPIVLPAKLPNLLLNGATGIAVGMATNIPPHNLGEVIDGILALIENKDITPVELMGYIKGPDFPTGGIIDGEAGIYDAYTTGRGRVRVRGKIEIEEAKNGRQSLIIKEIPYQLNKSSLIEKIANLVKEKKIVGISDLRDESDRDGIRVVIELKKGEEPELVLNSLYKYTELQTTFGIIMLALVNNVPRVLNLKEILEEYLKHRFEVVTRRTKFNLNKAERRDHLLKGFIIALENIDRVIEIVRGSSDGNEARLSLIDKYGFSEEQAKAILDMKLQRLTGLERDKIDREHEELKALIIELNEILADDNKIYEIIQDELNEIKNKYNDPRRTKIEKERLEIRPEDLIKDDSVLVTVTNRGYVKRMELDKYKAQKRGGKGVSTQNTIEDDFVERMEVMSNLDTMMIFTDKGRVFHLKVYQIPESSKQARGRLIGNLIKLKEDEKVREIIKIREFSQDKELVFVTRDGMVKKTNLSEYKNINTAGLKAIKLRDGDDIIFVGILPVESKEQIFLATKLGHSIRFSKDDVRPTGRDTSGVKGISLRAKDKVISALLIDDAANETILTITESGYGKRTRVDEYPLQSRSGKGVINIRCSDKNGEVVAVKPVKDEEELMVITSSGIVIRTSVNQISIIGRATQGVKIMRVNESESEKVVSIASFKEEETEDATQE